MRDSEITPDALQRAKSAFIKCDWPMVVHYCDQALAMDSKSQISYKQRGVAKRFLVDLQGSLKDCTIAIELDPTDCVAYYNRGETYSSLRDLDNAIRDFYKALELNPKDGDAYRRQGTSLLRKGRIVAALYNYMMALLTGGFTGYIWLIVMILSALAFFGLITALLVYGVLMNAKEAGL